MKQRSRSLRFALGVERPRDSSAFGLTAIMARQRRAAAIVGVDPRQEERREFLRRERAGVEGGVEIRDRGVFQIDARRVETGASAMRNIAMLAESSRIGIRKRLREVARL